MPLANRMTSILKVLASVVVIIVLAFAAAGIYLFDLSKSLPNLAVGQDTVKTARTSVVYAADGSVLAEWHGEEDRTVVPFDEMPPHLRNAVVAIEDRRFYEHNGVDTQAIGRALSVNAAARGVEQGGSTITQQVVKVLFTDGKRTLSRKVREALLAYQLEARTDKGKVLELYLNTIYFGNGAYGVESAAKRYFSKSTSSLSLAESATLAGVIRSPSRFAPTEAPDKALQRRNLVLKEMLAQGYISPDEARQARAAPLGIVVRKEAGQVAPYFVEYVKQELIARLGADKVYRGGLRVHTSLEPGLQALAEKSADQLAEKNDPEVALVAVRHATGEVLAMVGGRDYAENQFNLAVQGRRQPGSAFKPFVLVTALQQGVRPEHVFSAAPYSVRVTDGIWKVQNYENKITQGSLTLRAATNWSVNAVYARLIMKVGPEKVVETARKMGITTPLEPNPAIALGGLRTGVSPLEMASAYGTLANGGLRVRPTGIVRVTDDTGRVIYSPEPKPERVISRPTAVQASLMLHDVVEQGTGTAAKITTWAAGKTGTTQSYRDAWFVGWSGDVSTAVWVGHRVGQVPMTKVHGIAVTGGSFPARIWRQFMLGATKARSAAVTPAETNGTGEMLVLVCEDSMMLANKRCPNTIEIYLDPALVPENTCTLH